MIHIKVKILSNVMLKDSRFKIRLEAPSICKIAIPGQFVMVKPSLGLEPFLRRPLSFHRIRKNNFELLYEVIGKGTEILSQRRPGERLDIIGPLGDGFDLLYAKRYMLNAILVAGGIGVAPLVFLAERLTETKNLSQERDPAICGKKSKIKNLVIIGAKTKDHLLCADEFKRPGLKVKVATEDGSMGYKGLATDLLKRSLNAIRYPLNAIYACGPKEMLKAVARIAKSYKVPCQLSLEENMACGTGACLGCAVKTTNGFKMVCKDGPIFNAEDIIW